MVDKRKSCSGLCMVLVLYFQALCLGQKKSSSVFSEAIKNLRTTVLQSHVLVICSFHSANHDADRRPLVIYLGCRHIIEGHFRFERLRDIPGD